MIGPHSPHLLGERVDLNDQGRADPHYHPERFSREFLRKQQQYNEANPNTPIPRLTIHGLRHTWATIALKQKVHLKVVSERLNHSTTDITARVYSHVTRPVAQEAADLVGGLILGAPADLDRSYSSEAIQPSSRP